MTILKTARMLILAGSLCCSFFASAELAVPALSQHVTDQTGTLNTEQKSSLEQTLQSFEEKKGSQIAVLIIASTAPETIEQYSLRVAEQWKLGRKKIDDGAILVIAKNDRTLRIEVGYGLEGALNDATSKRIISETIIPQFKQDNYFGGISAGVNQMIQVVNGEPLPAVRQRKATNDDGIGQYLPVLFIFAMAAGGILRAIFGRLPGAMITGAVVAGLTWILAGAITVALIAGIIALIFTLFSGSIGGRRVGTYRGGGDHGGFGGGGFGGGGFSGGGGSFGGGGASGRW
ncbi:YgcG family protein [Undibacterium sp. 14-3-2]|uniref:TPM domain-containing protein n=1 Tax=Undibacterium sp. 14-3-2 TaxID=2800129 RepID=UPI0019068415|nr:YgcG family protein [Undibacterium sp. 14-3-2]MBK1889978.1 YgcG family protein [Undibacterium sp. 14-3-2]